MTELSSDLLARARSLRPLIESEAGEAEQVGTTTKPVVDAVAEQQLFWTMVPKECGGLEAPIGEALAVFEELSRADGSCGWTVMAAATASAFAGSYCGDEAAKEMFAGGAVNGIHAGQLLPRGEAKVHRRRLPGVRQVQLRQWQPPRHVDGGRYLRHEGRRDDHRRERVPRAARLFRPSRDRVTMLGNWDVMGLVATGSDDYEVPEQLPVDAGFTFSLLEAEPAAGRFPVPPRRARA